MSWARVVAIQGERKSCGKTHYKQVNVTTTDFGKNSFYINIYLELSCQLQKLSFCQKRTHNKQYMFNLSTCKLRWKKTIIMSVSQKNCGRCHIHCHFLFLSQHSDKFLIIRWMKCRIRNTITIRIRVNNKTLCLY